MSKNQQKQKTPRTDPEFFRYKSTTTNNFKEIKNNFENMCRENIKNKLEILNKTRKMTNIQITQWVSSLAESKNYQNQ